MLRLSHSLLAAAMAATFCLPGTAAGQGAAPPPPPAAEQPMPGALAQFREVLQRYGSFHDHPRYGEVWTPNPGLTPAGWRPYPACHWVYDRQQQQWFFDDRTPWGRIVHHHGRWAFDPHAGWLWVADDVFGPGWVAWRADARTVSWAALPPALDASAEPPTEHWHRQDARSFNAGCRQAAPAPVASPVPTAPAAPLGPRTAYAPTAPVYVPAPGYVPGPVIVPPPTDVVIYSPGDRGPGQQGEPQERQRTPPPPPQTGPTQSGGLPPLERREQTERGPRVTPPPPSQQGPLQPRDIRPGSSVVARPPVRPDQIGRIPSIRDQRTVDRVGRTRPPGGRLAGVLQVGERLGLNRPVAGRVGRTRPFVQSVGRTRPVAQSVGRIRPYASSVGRRQFGLPARLAPRVATMRPSFRAPTHSFARPAFRPSFAGPSRSMGFARFGRR